MQKTVFILGAGASHEGGAPLMNGFLDRARDLRVGGAVASSADHFDRVFKAVVKLRDVFYKSGLDLDNIESVFGAFEMARTIGKLGDYPPEEIENLVESTEVLIAQTLSHSIRYPYSSSDVGPPPPYGEFVKLLKDVAAVPRSNDAQRRYSILTFNYDLAVD